MISNLNPKTKVIILELCYVSLCAMIGMGISLIFKHMGFPNLVLFFWLLSYIASIKIRNENDR